VPVPIAPKFIWKSKAVIADVVLKYPAEKQSCVASAS